MEFNTHFQSLLPYTSISQLNVIQGVEMAVTAHHPTPAAAHQDGQAQLVPSVSIDQQPYIQPCIHT